MIVYPFSFVKSAGGGFDPDAAAYLSAVIFAGGAVSIPTRDAVNQLFIDLKSAGIYNELLAFYPVVGATEASTALNGIRNNNQFDILWLRPDLMVFDYSGVTGDGGGNTSGGITFLLPDNDFTVGNRHISFYSTGDKGVQSFGYECGGGDGNDNILIISYDETTGYFGFGNFNTYANTDQTGFYYTQLSGSTDSYNLLGYKNGTEVLNTTSSDSLGDCYLSVLCDNRTAQPSYSATECSDKRMGWASFGNDLTSTQISQFETIINTFQTSLGRNTY